MRLPTLVLILGLCQLCTCVIVYTTSTTQRPGNGDQVNVSIASIIRITTKLTCSRMDLFIGLQVGGTILIHPTPLM
jgi:hypothetical protein